jgi:hypothetical protein
MYVCLSVCLSITLIDLFLSSFHEKTDRPIWMKFFVVIKKSTEGDIGYLKLSHSILIQNGSALKLCLLRRTDPVQRTGQPLVITVSLMFPAVTT